MSRPQLGDPLVEEYLRFTAARVRPNSVVAQSFDLKLFFTVVAKPPQHVDVTDVLGFIEEQRIPRRGGNVVRPTDVKPASPLRRSSAGLRRSRPSSTTFCCTGCAIATRSTGSSRFPLVRAPKKMPRVLSPDEVHALASALRTDRDRVMIWLMAHAGLRRCEVLGLRFGDVHIGHRQVFIAAGGGGHQRLVLVVPTFFTRLVSYLSAERPGDAVDDHVFVVLKGPHPRPAPDRGQARSDP